MPAKGRKLDRPTPGKIAEPPRARLTGDWQVLLPYRFEKMKRVENPFPNPAPEDVLLRVCPNLQMKKFQALKRKLRRIERGSGDLRMFLTAGYFLAWLSLKKTGRKHRMPKPDRFLKEMEWAVPKLALLSRLSEEIRRKIVNNEMFLELPADLDDPELFCHDVIHHAPDVFDAYRRGTESFVAEMMRTAHPLVEIDTQLSQAEEALRPLKRDDMYGHLYNSRWALTAELVEAFGGNMDRKAIEKRTGRDGFFSAQKRNSAPQAPLPRASQ